MKSGRKKNMKRLLAGLLVLAMVCGYLPAGWGNQKSVSAATNSAIDKVADSSTANSYQEMLGTEKDGNRYSGRIWTDKSVFTGESVALGDTGIGAMMNDSDFMIVYSALGSTTSISTTTTVSGSLDVVVILDNSMSMSNGAGSSSGSQRPGAESSTTRLEAVTDAANTLISDILDSTSSRLAVVTYSTGAATLLPLDYYEQEIGSNNQPVDVLTVNSYSGNAGGGRMTAAAISKTTNQEVSNTNSGYQSGTNLQAGIDMAMDILLNAAGTSGRAPVIIVLTDGVADTAVDAGWYEVETTESVTDADTVHPSANTITAGVALSTLLNAAYKTSLLEEKYGANPTIYGIGVDLGDSSDAFVVMNPKEAFNATFSTLSGTAYSWYTKWYEGTDYTQSESLRSGRGSSTFSWDFNLPEGLSSQEQTALKAAVNANINYVDTYYNVSAAGTELEEKFKEIVQSMNQSVFHPITDTVVIGGETASTPLTYVDFIGEYMEVKDIKAVTVFGKQYGVTAGITSTQETRNADGSYTITATTTFRVGTDDDYISNAVMGTTAAISDCVTIELIETYTAVQTDTAFEKNSVSEQQLWVYIAENALPLIYDEVTDYNGNVTYTRTTANPIRVYYTVGVTDDIKAEDGTIMVSRISSEYLEANTDSNGNVCFYANRYGEMNGSTVVDSNGTVVSATADGTNYFYRIGDAHSSATPSAENRYYYHLANQGIFTAVSSKDGSAIDWDASEFGVVWEENKYNLTWMSYADYVTYNEDLARGVDHRVYTYVNFYSPTSSTAGEKVTYLVYTNWSLLQNDITFHDNVNGVYLNYDPDTKTISVGEKGNYIDLETLPAGVTIESIIADYVKNVAAYVGDGAKAVTKADIYAMLGIGSVRTPRLSNMAAAKSENETGTAYYSYVPARDADDETEHVGELVVWLGNNGRLTLNPTQGIYLTKSVTEFSDKTDVTVFAFEITVKNASAFDQTVIAVMDGYGKLVSGWTVSELSGNDTAGYECTITGNLVNGETAAVINLPAGAVYTVKETGTAPDYYDVTYINGSGTILNNTMTAVTATNDAKDYADLYITKEIDHSQNGHAVPQNVLAKEFEITVDFGTALAGQVFYFYRTGNAQPQSVTVEADGTNIFTIKHGETIQIIDLPVGAAITVTETLDEGNGTNFAVSYRSRNHSGTAADNDNKVTITVDGDNATHDAATVVVTNTYTPTPVTVDLDIAGTKKLVAESGTTPLGGSFTFVVQSWNGEKWVDIKDVTLGYSENEAGEKTFAIEKVLSGITYTEAGSWAYQVLEKKGTVANVTYDRTIYTFTVTVKDVDGQLVATVTDWNNNVIQSNSYNVTFENRYNAAPVSIDIIKEVVNKSGEAEISKAGFGFKVVQTNNAWNAIEGEVPFTVYSDAAGEARFAKTYTQEGTYYYVISEIGTDGNGWTYSKAEYRVKVTVTADGGNLSSTLEIVPENGTTVEGETATADGNSGKIYFKNTYDPKDASVNLNTIPTVKKVLTGRELTEADKAVFKFELYKDGDRDTVLATGTLGAKLEDGSYQVDFDKALTYTQIGTYYYDIIEVDGGKTVNGVTYDPTVYDMVVEVVDKSGELEATYYFEDATTQTVTFTNVYQIAGTATLDLSGLKTLENHPLAVGEFTFSMEVTDESGKVVRTTTTTNHANGSIVFPTITYTAENVGHTYTYTITEVVPDGAVNNVYQGITYDSTVCKVVVQVLDDGKGGVVLVVDGANDAVQTAKVESLNFTNRYAASSATIRLLGTKVMVNRPLVEDDEVFTFVVYEGETKVSEGKLNIVTGLIDFTEIKYTEPGEHVYQVYEVYDAETARPGVAYDETVYTINVKVTDDGIGALHAYVTSSDGDLVFTNTYHRENAEIELSGTKYLEGRDLVAGEFTFELYRADENFEIIGDVIRTATNDADGSFTFDKGVFSAPGIYRYVIVEYQGDAGGIQYDQNEYQITIKVEDNGNYDGKMTVTQIINVSGENGISSAENGIVFKNSYNPNSISVDLTLEEMLKDLSGRDLINGEFTFEVKDAAGKVVSTGKNDADGKIVFDKKLTFTEKGEYTYTVYEVAGDDGYITYDETVYTMTVTVTDDGEGTLTAKVLYGEDGKGETPKFENRYTPEQVSIVLLEALKEMVGRKLKDGEFTFEVKDETGKVVATGKNDADGKIVFGEIKLASGEYNYTISEVIGEAEDTIYDKNIYKVKVEIADADNDGVLESKITYPEGGVKFINEHYEGVDTGDNSQMILWGAIAALCVVAVGVLLVIRKKFNK